MVTRPKADTRPPAVRGQPARADGSEEGLNYSQLSEWMRCRYRWHLRNRRKIERRGVNISLDIGSAVHKGIAGAIRQHADQKDPALTAGRLLKIRAACSTAIDTYREEWVKEHGGRTDAEIEEQLAQIIAQAQEVAWNTVEQIDLAQWETLRLQDGTPLVEHKLTMPFLPGLPWYGTADWAAKDRTRVGGRWAIDFKVREKFQSVEHEETDLQLPSYQILLRSNGIPTTGTIKWQIRRELPKTPKRNKDGSVSRAMCATTWDIYRDFVVACGLDPKDYEEEMKAKLSNVKFVSIERLYRNDFYLNNVWEQVIVPNAKLFAKSKSFPRHMSYMSCSGCGAKDFCVAELRGEETTFLLETQYVDLHNPVAKVIMRPEDFDFEDDR